MSQFREQTGDHEKTTKKVTSLAIGLDTHEEKCLVQELWEDILFDAVEKMLFRVGEVFGRFFWTGAPSPERTDSRVTSAVRFSALTLKVASPAGVFNYLFALQEMFGVNKNDD